MMSQWIGAFKCGINGYNSMGIGFSLVPLVCAYHMGFTAFAYKDPLYPAGEDAARPFAQRLTEGPAYQSFTLQLRASIYF
jgi:hypothetical protein